MDDVEMDAPQISTLPEEGSPEPQQQPARAKPPRVKLRVSEGKPPVASASSLIPQPMKTASEDDEDDEDDEEEDQLIDDDDDDHRPAPTITIPVTLPPPPPTTPAVTRGSPAKRGVGRGRGGGRKRGGKADVPVTTKTTITVPPMINTTPEAWSTTVPSGSVASAPPAAARKRGGAGSRGGVAQRVMRQRAPRGLKNPASPAIIRDDAGSISEAYAGTAASSPMPHDEHSPEPEIPSTSLLVSAPADVEMNLEGVPLPVYPLPSKPYAVQQPPKIGTGFAPPIVFDKTGKQVRKWRQAHREIRGIAGGRWFTRAWIGDKESEYAAAQAAASLAFQNAAQAMLMADAGTGLTGVALPSLPSISMAGTGKANSRWKNKVSAAGTGQSSRAASSVPEPKPAAQRKRNVNVPIASGADTPVSISTPGP
ncbi:hypothetical protein BXZ70DRAFT_1008711 [Cristinia sonorae]|uniref:Uncharacterized protein n=1 Tax=Cristinia sonorae TaxID=1940300 RepID=A0A8K0UM21_9AGAR|nr:hypothetical protein BXZ70DRAFT_1008711 [Cristinia sonorae]